MLRTMPEGEGAEPSIRERIRTDRERWTELEERTRDRLLTHARAEAAAIEARLAARVPRPMRRLLGPAAHVFVRGRLDDLGTHAGALTYGAFLSIPPLLLFGSSLLGFAMVRDEGFRVRLLDAATAHFPALRSLLTADLRSAVTGRVSLGAIGVAGVLWASSGFAARARHAFGEVFRTRRTGLILGRFRGMVFGVVLVAALAALAIVTGLMAWAAGSGGWGVLIRVPMLVILAVGELGFFTLTYRLLTPGPGPTFREHLPGGVVFTIGWEGVKLASGLVFSRLIANSTALYGTVGGVFGLIASLYATMWLLLVGAETTAVLRDRRLPDPSGSPRASGPA